MIVFHFGQDTQVAPAPVPDVDAARQQRLDRLKPLFVVAVLGTIVALAVLGSKTLSKLP